MIKQSKIQDPVHILDQEKQQVHQMIKSDNNKKYEKTNNL